VRVDVKGDRSLPGQVAFAADWFVLADGKLNVHRGACEETGEKDVPHRPKRSDVKSRETRAPEF